MLPVLLWVAAAWALTLDPTLKDLICDALWEVLVGEFNYYNGFKYGGAVGTFVSPYYWWNAGEAFGGWVDHATLCGHNETFSKILYDAMLHQAGSNYDYMPSNQTMTEGNDDQGVWGMAIMQAVERNFTAPDGHLWLLMVQAVYNTMHKRWDDSTCGGGLRWQIFTWNLGYNYKNSIANGCLFHLSARLYRYTGLKMYLDTAEQVWLWMWDVGFMTNSPSFVIYDGAEDTSNCTDRTEHKWLYTYGIFLLGAAYLYNKTGDDKWRQNTLTVLDSCSYFFSNNVMQELTCQPLKRCNNDQRSFRLLFSRCLGLTASLVPETQDQIIGTWMTPLSKGAAGACLGGGDGITCGQLWAGGYDNMYGLGEQMLAQEAIMAMLLYQHPPLTPETGGTNQSVPNAGNSSSNDVNLNVIKVTLGDRAGAGILTAIVLGIFFVGGLWMLF